MVEQENAEKEFAELIITKNTVFVNSRSDPWIYGYFCELALLIPFNPTKPDNGAVVRSALAILT
jgi:hypothetical protein